MEGAGGELLTRVRLLKMAAAAAIGALWAGARPDRALGWFVLGPRVHELRVSSRRPYAGDHPLLATVDPRRRGRRAAVVSFRLDVPATVRLQALRTSVKHDTEVWQRVARLGPGRHRLVWKPHSRFRPRTYLLRLTVTDLAGRTSVYGGRPPRRRLGRGPVVRVLGVEASFAKRSYRPGRRAALRVSASARRISVQFFRSGAELISTNRSDELSGLAVSDVWRFDWRRRSRRPHILRLRLGDWPSGLYYARLTTDDGRVGFAPLIVRPAKLGLSRVAVVMPTNTWQAYNFRDRDGDGWGDTWYAGGSPPVVLNRPYLKRGVPPFFKYHDRGFQLWLHRTKKQVDMLSDDDLERFPSGDRLRQLYDLIVFPGHSEYMTRRAYFTVARFRDLGGNLLFLSANNFFWCVRKRGGMMRRHRLFRELGKGEAALLGSQYRANDDGGLQRPFAVRNAAAAPWLWEGTGLSEGSTFGETVGGFGTEIDAITRHSPRGTLVVAEIVDIFGPGLTAQMTYYESPNGARVFSAGALDYCGSVALWPMRRMLENVWRRMTEPQG